MTTIIDSKTGEIIPPEYGLVLNVRDAIQKVDNLVSAMDVNTMAKAAEAFYHAQGMEENAQKAKGVSLWAQRKAGEFIKDMPKATGGEQYHEQPTGTTMEPVPTLDDLDIDKHESHRWQLLASIPEEDFQGYVDEKIARGYELTTGGLIQIAKNLKKNKEREELEKEAEKQEAKTYAEFKTNDVYVADIRTLELPESSVDMIFTDPPYDEVSLPLFSDLARFAYRVLKPGGYLMTYTGKMFLPVVMSLLGECLEYVWTYGVFQPDSNHQIQKHHIFQTWRPILTYKKPGKTQTREWQPDMIKGTRDKSFHEWQQQIEPALKWIQAYTLPGELVVDPFVGGGTTLFAAKQLKRQYLGFDVDPQAVKITKTRLQ